MSWNGNRLRCQEATEWGAEQKLYIFTVNEFPGIEIIQQILRSFITFIRAKVSALLVLSSTHKPSSLLFVVHCFASAYTVFHITRKQTNSTSPTCFFPLQTTSKKLKHFLQHWDMEFSNGAFIFLFFCCSLIGFVGVFFCCVCHFLLYFVL